jgi:hypothetical protein
MLNQKTLDHLWDFDNPELSEQRFREAMADDKYDADERAELATQLGRAIGLHMLAIADTDHAELWTRSALEYASTAHDPNTRRWMIALHNNLGRILHRSGRLTEALVEFQLAEQWAGRVGTPAQQQYAREAIAECEHALAS